MTDLVKLVRSEKALDLQDPKSCENENTGSQYPCAPTCPCALRDLAISQADEIERLRAENDELREALLMGALTKIEAYRIIKESGARSHADIAAAFDKHFEPVRAALTQEGEG